MSKNIHGQETEDKIRPGTVVDLEKLGLYFTKSGVDFTPPYAIKQFKLGQSNPTFLLIDANDRKMVVRKKPPGNLLSKTAHAIDREFRVLNALGTHTKVPVPKVIHYCHDVEVLGTEFYTMEFLKGRIFADVTLPTVPIKDTAKYYASIVETLAKLHSVNVEKVGLSDYGRHGGFYQRQLESLYKLSQVQAAVKGSDGVAVGELYRLPEIIDWMTKNVPADQVTLIHGDFKTDNIVFHPEQGQVIGMLDWELSTIGHPLSDLANLLLPWYTSHEFGFGKMGGLMDLPRPLKVPEADELIKQYCQLRNLPYPIPNWNFCIAFAFFRLAIITQGIAARVKRNQASSGFASEIAQLFQPCAKRVFEIAYGPSAKL